MGCAIKALGPIMQLILVNFAGAKNGTGGEFNVDEEVKYWLYDVNCNGDEKSLFACEHHGIGHYTCCGQRNRAKVKCEGVYDYLYNYRHNYLAMHI